MGCVELLVGCIQLRVGGILLRVGCILLRVVLPGLLLQSKNCFVPIG